ncbi:MAG: hypothetical protein EXX96DRAFT_542498 [Benjaminiella poitrasii]|nr:MAG: hypothetical protein EXX96DRAFT_542498 [Benjaminiella poitrasii]
MCIALNYKQIIKMKLLHISAVFFIVLFSSVACQQATPTLALDLNKIVSAAQATGLAQTLMNHPSEFYSILSVASKRVEQLPTEYQSIARSKIADSSKTVDSLVQAQATGADTSMSDLTHKKSIATRNHTIYDSPFTLLSVNILAMLITLFIFI